MQTTSMWRLLPAQGATLTGFSIDRYARDLEISSRATYFLAYILFAAFNYELALLFIYVTSTQE